jgi:hypothetical protein
VEEAELLEPLGAAEGPTSMGRRSPSETSRDTLYSGLECGRMLAELAGQLLRLRLVAVDNLDLVSTRHGAGLDPFRSAHPARRP